MNVVSVEKNSIGLLANIELVLADKSGTISWWIVYDDIYGNNYRTAERTITVEHKHVEQGGGGCNTGVSSIIMNLSVLAFIIINTKKNHKS